MMNHDHIKALMPILIREFQSGGGDKSIITGYFANATPETVIMAMNMVRSIRKDDGSDGEEKYYTVNMSGKDLEYRDMMKIHMAGLDSKLLVLWKFLVDKLEKSKLATVSITERAYMLDYVLKNIDDMPTGTRIRNKLFGQILGISSSLVPDAVKTSNNDNRHIKARSYLHELGFTNVKVDQSQ